MDSLTEIVGAYPVFFFSLLYCKNISLLCLEIPSRLSKSSQVKTRFGCLMEMNPGLGICHHTFSVLTILAAVRSSAYTAKIVDDVDDVAFIYNHQNQ